MTATIGRWGNSLALRLPKTLAQETGITEDSPVDVSVQNGVLIIKPIVAKRRLTLDELLDLCEGKEWHGEVNWGEDVGKEIIP